MRRYKRRSLQRITGASKIRALRRQRRAILKSESRRIALGEMPRASDVN